MGNPEEAHRALVQGDLQAGELRRQDYGAPGEGAVEEADGREGEGALVGVDCGHPGSQG